MAKILPNPTPSRIIPLGLPRWARVVAQRRPDLTRSLRSAANRRAVSRKSPADDSSLVQAARAGILSNANTKPGTRGRQAVDRATYLRRRQRHADESARHALGHRSSEDRTAVWSVIYVDGPPRILREAEINRRDARRVARHLSLVAQLAEAHTPERASEAARRLRRVRSWRPLTIVGPREIAGEVHFLADPDALLALADRLRAEEGEVVVSYGRSSRTRTTTRRSEKP
jgi:hypothetical protein